MPHTKNHPPSTRSRVSRLVARARETTVQKYQIHIKPILEGKNIPPPQNSVAEHNDKLNYVLLIALYTLQGVPMGLSASIPFLLQEKITKTAQAAAAVATVTSEIATTSAAASVEAAKASYNANAIFALCSWPFSLKLLWAPIVDAIYFRRYGRRKSWLVPVQTLAGIIMLAGADFVEQQLGLSHLSTGHMNVQGVTSFFFVLYFLMATQDIAVDGWALTMLSKSNRGKGPICNSIGQNIGYFLSFVGFLALNDAEASETLWRPLLRLPSNPHQGLVSLKGFLRCMGVCMLATTAIVALFKRELPPNNASTQNNQEDDIPLIANTLGKTNQAVEDDDAELDASEIGLKETYKRLWAVCQLPSVRWLFLMLVTYRLPTSLSDNVKFLKAVEYGLSKSTTALLSPTVILPLGILVPIVAHRIWHMAPLQQFKAAYQWRVTLVPLLDLWMLHLLRRNPEHTKSWAFWLAMIASTAGQAMCNSLQFNAQMIFFASRVDPAIGGSYMTLLNTAANLGGTWPSSFVMWLLGRLTGSSSTAELSTGGIIQDPYMGLQVAFSALGILWLIFFSPRLRHLAELPDDAWRTHILDSDPVSGVDLEIAEVETSQERLMSSLWPSQQDNEKDKER